jgi:hypothetical protein
LFRDVFFILSYLFLLDVNSDFHCQSGRQFLKLTPRMASHAAIFVVEEKESGKERTEEHKSGASLSKESGHDADLQRWNCCRGGRQVRGQGRE